MNHDEVKASLLRVAKEMIACGLVEGTAGNVSARLPDGNVVLTPSSIDYGAMTLDDLVVTDINGNVLEGEKTPTTEKALHLDCLRKHQDIGAVMHCHAMFATMFAIVRQPIPCVIEEFDVYVGGDVEVADYKMTGSDALGEEVSDRIGDKGAVLMANHGLLCVGKDPVDVLKVAKLVERTAQIVWGARLLGEPVPLPSATREQFAPLYKLMGRNP
jgi:L-fuculose-phosphate aldolase|tara:strand:- start:893 stop:1537 length:645 start_codon:yes stop_codon:yes gene_type:complete